MTDRPIRLIASDLDGTLLRPDHRLSVHTIEVLEEIRSAGYKIVAATGRGPRSVWPAIEGGHHLFDMVLTSNGALVLDPATKMITKRFAMDAAKALAMVEKVRSELSGVAFGWECASGFGWDLDLERHAPFLDEFDILDHAHDKVAFDATDQLTKVLISHPTVIRKELMELVAAMAPGLVVTSSGVDFVEVSGAGIDKAHGLQHLCDAWNIDAAEVMTFGDNWNDMAMLDWAGHGVAMGHAHDDVIAVANEQIGSNADDAVANYLATTLREWA